MLGCKGSSLLISLALFPVQVPGDKFSWKIYVSLFSLKVNMWIPVHLAKPIQDGQFLESRNETENLYKLC